MDRSTDRAMPASGPTPSTPAATAPPAPTVTPTGAAPAGPHHRVAVSLVFAGNGALFGSLYARLPEIADRLDLSEGELGLALLGGPIGLVAAVVIAGTLIARKGSRWVSAIGAALYAGALVLPAVVPSLALLVLAMGLLGAGSGTLDVAMNAQGVTVERRYPRRIFASLHAAFSVGALAGAGSAGLLAQAGTPLAGHLLGVTGFVGIALALGVRAFLPDPPEARTGPVFARPSRDLAALGVVAVCALLAEGAMSDWSAVYLTKEQAAGPATAAAGLAAFSLAMAAGRLAGDPLAERVGSSRLARGGLLLATVSFAGAAFAPGATTAIGAFVVLGLGLAAVYPLCLRAAAASPDRPAAASIAAITTTGYTGFLAGPPLVGLLAEVSSLRASLLALAALCLLAAVLARAVQDAPALS